MQSVLSSVYQDASQVTLLVPVGPRLAGMSFASTSLAGKSLSFSNGTLSLRSPPPLKATIRSLSRVALLSIDVLPLAHALSRTRDSADMSDEVKYRVHEEAEDSASSFPDGG
jgi:hypothetical protein